jgi:hypothetical protein
MIPRYCVVCSKEMFWNKETLMFQCYNPKCKFVNIFEKAENEEEKKKIVDETLWSNTQIGLYLFGGTSFVIFGLTKINDNPLYFLGIIFGIFFIFASLGAIHGRMKK